MIPNLDAGYVGQPACGYLADYSERVSQIERQSHWRHFLVPEITTRAC